MRVVTSWRRRRARELLDGDVARQPDALPLADELVDQKRRREVLDELLDGLDHDLRVVFVLYELEELPMKEVAAVIGCPIQTAYSRLHRARGRVEKAFKAIAKEGGGPLGPMAMALFLRLTPNDRVRAAFAELVGERWDFARVYADCLVLSPSIEGLDWLPARAGAAMRARPELRELFADLPAGEDGDRAAWRKGLELLWHLGGLDRLGKELQARLSR